MIDENIQHEYTSPVQEPKSLRQKILGPLAGIGILIAKFFKLIILVLKGGKFFGTMISMVISIGVYTLFFGPGFAIGFVLLLYVHEMGHAIQLRREGIRAGAPIFIPLLGAMIAMKEMPKNAATEARVGLAGPVLGSVGVAVCGLVAYFTNSDFWMALTYTGAFLNLFNLLPVSPLDGGRAMAAVSTKLWIPGMLLLFASFFFIGPNPILFIIILLGGLETFHRLRNRKNEQEYYQVPTRTRFTVAFVYIALALILIAIMSVTHVQVN